MLCSSFSGGCVSLDRRPSLESKRGPTFGETVKLQGPEGQVRFANGTAFFSRKRRRGSRFGKSVYRSKHFDFDGVKRSEQEMARQR